MHAYGKPRFPICCPGHDTFSRECYDNNRSKRAQTRDTKLMHRIERRKTRQTLRCTGVGAEGEPA